ncbi:MAG TPA: hemerythrin domain-containing protein [Acidimicrobiales bacterium]|jgi:hemerythrin superfamily protein|nr:hemerythrin domain-containing protein [Acidimicrobiales bacterium]
MADAITLLKDDHRSVEKLFKSFEQAGPKALKTKARLVEGIVRDLTVHASIEEQIFYPRVRQDAQDLEADVLEALEEHHVAKWLLSELDGLDPSAERFEAKVTVLIESVRHHVKEEERSLFPAVRKAFGRPALAAMGDALAAAKKGAPVKPRPRLPDEPPLNRLADAGAGAVDRALGTLKKAKASR